MADRRLAFIIAVAVAIIIGTLSYRAYFPGGEVELVPLEVLEEAADKQRQTRVWAVLKECNRTGNRTEAQGYIENTGNVELNYVTVKVIWSNREGLVIEENELYALSNQPLAPGETRNFTDVTEKTTAAQCNVKPVDWW